MIDILADHRIRPHNRLQPSDWLLDRGDRFHSLPPDGFGNANLMRVAKVRRHGQAQASNRNLFSRLKITRTMPQLSKCPLQVQWHRVIGHRWGACHLQPLGQGIPVFGQDGILGIDRVITFADDRCLNTGNRGQQVVVSLSHGPPEAALLREKRQLLQKDRSLHRIQPSVDPHQWMLVLYLLAMDPDPPDLFRQPVVVGEEGAAVAIASQGFEWEKRGAADG